MGEVVGDGVGSGAGAAHCSDCEGVSDLPRNGADAAHIDATGVVVVAVGTFGGDSFRACPAQKSSP